MNSSTSSIMYNPLYGFYCCCINELHAHLRVIPACTNGMAKKAKLQMGQFRSGTNYKFPFTFFVLVIAAWK